MILETKRLWFKKATIFLEDTLPSQKEMEKKYHSVDIFSHDKLDLPSWKLREKTTAVINLTGSIDEVFNRFNKTTRNEINKTLNRGDLKFYYQEIPSKEVYTLYTTFEKSQGRKPISRKEFSCFPVMVGYINEKAVSGVSVAYGTTKARIRSIFSSRYTGDKAQQRLVSNISRRVMGELCMWCRKERFESLDLASVNLVDPEKARMTEYKMSFGGRVIPEYNYMYKSNLFLGVSNLKRLLK